MRGTSITFLRPSSSLSLAAISVLYNSLSLGIYITLLGVHGLAVGFKVREGWPIGCKVTLRSDRMYEFLERLVDIAIPRIRDFRGISPKSFDGRGNFAMGVTEQIIFPEIDYDKIDKLRGLDVNQSL